MRQTSLLVPLARARIALRQRRHYGRLSRDAEVSPWRIVWIDPRTVTEVPRGIGRVYPKQDRALSHVLGGDWDLKRRGFWEKNLTRSIRARIVDGVAWERTDLVIRLTERLSRPGAEPEWHGCRTPADIMRRCAHIDRLAGEIREHGYRTPSRVQPGVSGLTADHPPDAIAIGIGRDGDILHVNGSHRLAIAKSLELDSIPVRIGIRHERWQARRRALATSDDDTAHHPDVAYLRDEGSADE